MSKSKRFDRALEKLLADRSPRREASYLDREEQRLLRVAQLLRGSRGQAPSGEFIGRLRAGIFLRQRHVSRRAALLSGLGAVAAGLVAGFELDRATHNSTPTPPLPTPLVGSNGRWFPVARLVDVPDGTIKPFAAGALEGFLIHRGQRLYALSRICTHMGCLLHVDGVERGFVCPCHGAKFDLRGRLRPKEYSQPLPPLPEISVRVDRDSVEVWSI